MIDSVIHILYILTTFLSILSVIERKVLKLPNIIEISLFLTIPVSFLLHVFWFVIRHINIQDCYILLINGVSVFFLIFFALKSTLSNRNIVPPAFFGLELGCYVFFYYLACNLLAYLYFKWVSCRQYIVEFQF